MGLKTTGMIFVLLSTLCGCVPEGPPLVEAKVFSLNPSEYQENIVNVSGTVKAISAGGVLIDVYDSTGPMRISTEKQPEKPNCQIGDKIEATVLLADVAGQPCLQAQMAVKCTQ